MKRRGVAAATLVAGLTLACTRADTPASDTVARIGERELSYSDFESYLELNSLDGEVGLPSAVLTGLFDQFVLEELLLEVARAEGMGEGDRRRVVERLVARRVAQTVDESAVAAYYREHPKQFELPERIDLRQILVNDRATAEAALARLRAGESFAAVAADAEGEDSRGGWIQEGLTSDSLPPAFAETIFALESGEISEIVEADYGFFLFEVSERHAAQELSLVQATPRIRATLEREAADRALGDLVEEATGRYNVAVFEQNLPFDYLGTYRSKV